MKRFFASLGVTGWCQIPAQREDMPTGQLLCGLHPHGSYVLGGLINLAPEPRDPDSPGHGLFIGIADALFHVPVLREVLLTLNCRPANEKMLDTLLSAGRKVAVYPGGIHEQMATDPSQERVFFSAKLGFVRLAIKHGVRLLPIYTFGENQLYDVPVWGRRFSARVRRLTGAGVPLVFGRFGLPFLPKPTEVRTYVGNPVEVGPAEDAPSQERVREVYDAYCAELRRLFEAHKDEALPKEVATKGLEIVWRRPA